MIKYRLVGALLWLTVALTACGGTNSGANDAAGNAAPGTPTAHMSTTTFDPPSTTIQTGNSLTLVADTFAPHVISNGTWAQGTAKPGREPGAPEVTELKIDGNGSGTIGPFTTAGTFQFYCTIHPDMNLSVVVQ